MAQWINVLRNNNFINPMRLPLLCRNYRAVALAKSGLTAGWLAGRRMQLNFKFLKFIVDQIFKTFCSIKHSYSIIRAI